MPDARTHDLITLATGAALVPLAYIAQVETFSLLPMDARTNTAWLVGAHLVSGIMFSPDLDLDSAIDDRWGILFWIWRPYMWALPHRHFWSHSLVFAPLLRLAYFYFVVIGFLVGGAWLLGRLGIVVPYYHEQFTAWLIFPAEAQVRAEAVVARVVLHEPAEEHERRERIVDTRHSQIAAERSLGEVHPVERDGGLEREVGIHVETNFAES